MSHAGFPRAIPEGLAERKALRDNLIMWRAQALSWIRNILELQREPIPPLHLRDRYTDLYKPSMSPGYRKLKRSTDSVTALSPGVPSDVLEEPASPRPLPEAFVSGAHATIYALKPIRTGIGRLSQLYLGTLGPPDDSTSTRVVVKVYQTSLLDPVVWMQLPDDEKPRNPFFDALLPFRAERWAYESLKPIQGTVVPHVYGFFEVILPTQEPCIALVTEYISCNRLSSVAKHVGNDNIDKVATGLLLALHAVQAHGVGWDNCAPRNILLKYKRPSQPVFFNFSSASDAKQYLLYKDLESIVDVLVYMGFSEQRSLEWLEWRLSSPEWAALFDLPLRRVKAVIRGRF